ncbi:MAG TPA: oxidoreductase [Nocardioidaceae bacterium]|nr:oxidoreductase [Nocardioidaceae bacterium]
MHPDGTWSASDLPDLSGRRALVTGTTSGLGAAVVAALVRRGAEVVAAGRDEHKLTASLQRLRAEVPGARVRTLLLDLADQADVRRAAHEAASHGPLHLLVNNAGVMATPSTRTLDGFELQLATNFLGHFALTGLLWPQLATGGAEPAAGGAARVVSVSSQAHRMARRAPLGDPRSTGGRYQRWQAYAQSKLANLLFTVELDRRARSAGAPVTALAAHPGMAATSLGSSATGNRAGGTILDAAFSLLGQPPSQAAQPLLMAATADLPGATYVGPGGPGEVRGAPQVVTSSALARDPETARRLWAVAEQATGVRFP